MKTKGFVVALALMFGLLSLACQAGDAPAGRNPLTTGRRFDRQPER